MRASAESSYCRRAVLILPYIIDGLVAVAADGSAAGDGRHGKVKSRLPERRLHSLFLYFKLSPVGDVPEGQAAAVSRSDFRPAAPRAAFNDSGNSSGDVVLMALAYPDSGLLPRNCPRDEHLPAVQESDTVAALGELPDLNDELCSRFRNALFLRLRTSVCVFC